MFYDIMHQKALCVVIKYFEGIIIHFECPRNTL